MLDERKQQILKAIIDEYIENAEPVGSKAVGIRGNLNLSSATIRNEMSDLEKLGYLLQPHISAGRIPSQQGYRFYVNSLMHRYRLSVEEMEAINLSLRARMLELEKLVKNASKIISDLTNYTTYAVMPSAPDVTIRKADLLYIDNRSFVIVLLTSSQTVKNKLIRTQFPITNADVAFLDRIIKECFLGKTLNEITLNVIRQAEYLAENLSVIISDIVDFIAEVIEEKADAELYAYGVGRILNHPEYRDTEKARRLLEYLSQKHRFDEFSKFSTDDSQVQIAIGNENTAEPLRDASVVYGAYGIGENFKGIIGVVGPTRMDYAKVYANLNYFIENLNDLIKKTFFNE